MRIMPPKTAPPRLTHFLSIALVSPVSRPQLQSSLDIFRSDVIKPTSENPDGIPEKAVRPVGTLHLTLGVMSLLTPERVEEAGRVLGELDLRTMLEENGPRGGSRGEEVGEKGEAEKSLQHLPLKVTLHGLKSMQKASKTSVLYTSPVDEDQRLHSFCSKLKSMFADADLLVKDTRPLLLHATLLNMVYVARIQGGGKRKMGRVSRTIEATKILKNYEETVWMKDVEVRKVGIWRMGAMKNDSGEEEEYGVEAEVEMPA